MLQAVLIVVAAIVLAPLLVWAWTRIMAPFFRALAPFRRLRLPKGPVPKAWRAIVARNVPLSKRLNDDERERLLKLAQLFVRDIPMEGVQGLDLTEEMRVTIAAQACLLVVNLHYPWFPKLRRVLVYPGTFAPVQLPSLHGSAIPGRTEPTAGQAWTDGMVILSWSDARVRGSPDEAYNVILHEFAHILDAEDGHMDGTPLLEPPSSPGTWERVLADAFARQQRSVEEGEPAMLRDYGATKRSEFFAVATEAFFETPTHLRAVAPEWYDELRTYYRQDPAAR